MQSYNKKLLGGLTQRRQNNEKTKFSGALNLTYLSEIHRVLYVERVYISASRTVPGQAAGELLTLQV